MKTTVITAHAGAECAKACWESWGLLPVIVKGFDGMLPAYEEARLHCDEYDLLVFLHDDLLIHDRDWLVRVEKEFSDPKVGLVGFAGGLVHGSPDLYRTPYKLQQLGRGGFRSNLEDAETHGERFTGSCDIAVLDGFALIVRREILEQAGGWPLNTPIGYSNYDYWLGCETHRQGYKIRLVGVSCKHLGGQTSVKLGLAGSGEAHDAAHLWLYNEYKDVLPWSCL